MLDFQRIKGKIHEFYLDRRHYLKRPKPGKAKVFCIGYNKTGTTSLGHALADMGYDHMSYNGIAWKAYKDWSRSGWTQPHFWKIVAIARRYDSFDDLPYNMPKLFPVLDRFFPGSKFIYLERDPAEWLESYRAWSERTGRGPTKFRDDIELAKFEGHRDMVHRYFKDRPEDWISLDISVPMVRRKLGNFLGKPVPDRPFDWRNKRPPGGRTLRAYR